MGIADELPGMELSTLDVTSDESVDLCIGSRRSAGWCLRLRACRGRVRRGAGRNPVIGGPGPCHVEQDQHKICAGNGSEDRGDSATSRTPLGGEVIEGTNP